MVRFGSFGLVLDYEEAVDLIDKFVKLNCKLFLHRDFKLFELFMMESATYSLIPASKRPRYARKNFNGAFRKSDKSKQEESSSTKRKSQTQYS
jgi:hypothetical protein